MRQHVKVVAYIQIGYGILRLLVAGAALFFILLGGLVSGDPDAMLVTGIVGPAIACFLFVTAVPSIVGGIGLLRAKTWARILVIVLAALGLLDFPIGTATGIYSLWVLLNSETHEYFNGDSENSGKLAFS